MLFQYCSDLHLEFSENKIFLKANPLRPNSEILVLAGDVMPFTKLEEFGDFLDYISEKFGITYWLPGNHEYYFADANKRSGTFLEKIRDNIILTNNMSFEHGNTKFIFSTLWSKISPANKPIPTYPFDNLQLCLAIQLPGLKRGEGLLTPYLSIHPA